MEPEPQEVNGTFNLEFEIVDDSSKRGRPKLVDNRGYSYNIQRHCVYFNSFLYKKSYLYCGLFQVQELGLQQAYRNDRGTHNLVRKLLALPFLPADEIPKAFHRLEAKAATAPLQALAQYINNTWISSTTWHPSCWSVFQQSVRTNNDTEGWHHGLNRRAQGKSQLPFYLLVALLFQEAKLTSLQIRLVSDKKLKRIQRKEYRNVQARLFEALGKYQNGNISVEGLLKTASHLVPLQI